MGCISELYAFCDKKIPKYSNYSILNLLNLIFLNNVSSKVNSKLVNGATCVFSHMIVSINVNIKLPLNILKLLFNKN